MTAIKDERILIIVRNALMRSMTPRRRVTAPLLTREVESLRER